MSVELDPPELGFRRPFTQEVSQVLRLHNSNSDPVAFKVKTTAPKQYCVRPNSGRIDSGKDVEVQVLLQAMKEDPPLDAKCRDKFLVQSVAVKSDSNDTNISQIWSSIEQNAKSSIQEKKIRVSFLPADGTGSSTLSPASAAGVGAGAVGAGGVAAAAAATTNGVTSNEDSPPAYSSPSSNTPQRSSAMADKSTTDATDATETTTFAAASSAIPTSQEDLKQQLEDAKAQIAKLQGQVQEGIRQRKPQEAAEKAMNSVQQSMQNAPAPGGVPIQIVAGLCLLCFIIAWLFF